MPYHIYPKRYAIDDWHQAANARSNLDPTLRIRVTDFSASDVLAGMRIQVWHPEYGILFACLPVAYGSLLTDGVESSLTTKQILAALNQLGFDIQFKVNAKVNSATRAFLVAAMNAGYTHVRWAIKKHIPNRGTYESGGNCTHNPCSGRKERIVICFNETRRPEFLSQKTPTITNFGGDIMQVSPDKNPNLDFTWLDVPLEIESILNR